jgi:hypothetical protein
MMQVNRSKEHMKKLKVINRTKFMFYSSLVLFVSSFVFLVAALQIESATTPKQTTQALYTPGSQIVSGKAQFQIDNITYSNGSSHFAAPEGKQYLILSFTLKNVSKETISILPANDTYVKDSNGNVYSLSPVGLDNPFRAGELLPGDTITGQLSYLVPKDTPLKLYIDALWSGSLIAIAVK